MEDAQMAQGLGRQGGAATSGPEEAALLFGTALERVRVFQSLHGRLPEPAGAGEPDEPDEPILGAWLDHQRHRRAKDGLPPWKDNELTRALGSMWWSGEEGGGTGLCRSIDAHPQAPLVRPRCCLPLPGGGAPGASLNQSKWYR